MLNIFSKINILLSLILMLFLTGCFLWKEPVKEDPFSHVEGNNIGYVMEGFNKEPDIVEDWGGYKRYTWRVCKNTGRSVIGVRNNNDKYYMPEIRCCDAQFDVNWNSKIVNHNGEQLKYCPIDVGFKK